MALVVSCRNETGTSPGGFSQWSVSARIRALRTNDIPVDHWYCCSMSFYQFLHVIPVTKVFGTSVSRSIDVEVGAAASLWRTIRSRLCGHTVAHPTSTSVPLQPVPRRRHGAKLRPAAVQDTRAHAPVRRSHEEPLRRRRGAPARKRPGARAGRRSGRALTQSRAVQLLRGGGVCLS